ncbi:Regulating synaptic membrane exocytosis protein 2 [Cyphomyrmex costatus]|uniref:Regulating synaptic membrane exocytosis protein 2 n=1 Tax=Cyphomyrmex costatus TaxID=456900 RepID=A0A195CWM7_9HYME|nr:Regulating synaptic membrane exocytosis protein 2 [Cyphomyrmex costatus]
MTKTGLGAVDNALLRQMQEDLQVGGRQGLADQTRDKRPKLERAHSAAEKENLPLLQRSGNCPLRRQYSQQEQISGRRMSTSDSGVEMSVSPHARTLPTPHVVGSYPVQQTPRHPAAYPDDDPNLYRGELDGLMKQHPQNYSRQRLTYQDQGTDLGMTYGQTPMETGSVRSAVHPSQHSLHQTQGGRSAQPTSTVGVTQQRSFSSSEEERSTPECASDEPDESEKGLEEKPREDTFSFLYGGKGCYHHAGGPKSMSSGGRRHNGSHNGHHGSGAGMTAVEHNGHHPPREPRKEESTLVRRSFRRCGDEWRADSRRFTERRGKKTVRFDGGTNVGGPQEEEWSWEADRQGSQDSATKDSGIDTSSTFTSSEDSNRGDLPKHPSWQVSEDGQKLIGHMVLRKSAGSGSCSSILGLKVVGGKLLEDGSMGALIEKVKKGSTADVEGQLRPGDEVIAWNGRSLQSKSFREVSDIIAESRLDPQIELVVERKLSTTGMAPAGPGPSTPMASRRIVAQSQWRQKHETISGPPTPHHKVEAARSLAELYDARREKPSVLVTSPGSPDLHAQGRSRHSRHPTGNANVGGSIQVKLGFDPVGLQLIVTIICAAGLTPKSNGQPRNPYAKVFLLPDKSEKSKRRTKTVGNTNDPRWNQTFVYNGVRRSELRKRALEISVWDYARYEANDFLGEAVLELAVCLLDEEPEWHSLTAHGEHRHVRHYQDDDMIDCHLSPPSTTSRLSDSDTSECDITDCDVSREQRRTADGASISSIGSSSSHYSSPPPERELCIDGEHRSRRDMSPQGRKRAALMISRDQPATIGSSYQTYRKDEIHRGMMGHRSHSAAPMDSPNIRYRVSRSQSPTGHRSLSPPEHRSIPYSSHGYVHTTRFTSRSATATPTGSPKKRQLPQIPAALKERVVQDFEERARFMRHRNRQSIYRSTGMGSWERHYSGLSDSDLPSIGHDPLSLSHSYAHRMHRSRKDHLSPDKDILGDLGDSDMESLASVTSSAFSTQSERPRGSRALIPTVLIPGAISPIPPPPRRNRRRHKLRVPCSECHCPTKPKSNNPSKCPTLYPLVRSKSAVVRSLYKKMCTPFTRSQTVDENMLRYSSETSEYSVSEGYILKPERLVASSAKKHIPTIYVEDCLRVNFNDRFVEKFRSRYSMPYLAGGFGTLTRTKTRTRRPIVDSLDLPDYFDIRNIDARLHPRRSFLSAKTRSFDVMHDTYGDRFGTRPGAVGLLSRRAKSFEYESISSNIFSDDSLRTARRKLKRNLSLSDAGYGDKIPALDDQSKSYYDSNGDDKVPTSLKNKETNYDFLLDQDHKPFYGYDSELSCGETEIYVSSFDKQNTETNDYQVSYSSRLTDNNDLFSDNDRANLRNILDKDDTSKKKYADGSYLNHDTSYIKDISPGTRTKKVDSDLRTSIGDRIYSSTEEAFSSSKNYDRDILARSSTKIHDITDMDEWMSKDVKGVLRSHGATGHSYQEDRPRNRAPRPGNANSSLFDSQTATSDTAKNYHPRINDHHHQHPQNTKTSPLANVADVASTFLPPLPPSSLLSARRRPRKKSAYDVDVVAAVADRRDDDDARNRRSSSMPESSEYTSQSSSYEKTSRRQVTDNGHDEHDKRSQFTRSLSNADVPQDEKDTGSFSDTAIALNVEEAARRGRKSSPGSKSGSGSSSGSAVQYQAGLGKKSNSTSQLSATECGGMIISIGGSAGAVARGAGLSSRKRNSTPCSIQRSEEIMPAYQRLDNKGSAASDTAGSLNSISSSEGSSWSPSLRMAGDGQLRNFIEDLGPGQVVGRQALATHCLGEIQLSLSHTKGYLEVEVIRAKELKAKQGSRVIPASYVKLYLVNGKKCIEKAKTTTARKTLDPFYGSQLLAFKENCRGCILQVTVWGDYGRLEGKKVFMGIAQIVLDELDLNQMVIGWYKLFDTQALVSGASSLALSRRSSVTSLDSFKI